MKEIPSLIKQYEPRPNEVWYHYCSAESFMAITKNKTLRFCDLRHMNDLSELALGEQLLYDVIEDKTLNNNQIATVLRAIDILDNKKVSKDVYYYVSEVLKWMDVSKTGSKEDRRRWKKLGYDLYIHNIASAMIYKNEVKDYDEVVYILIKTHGLIGQYIRGETNLTSNSELYQLIQKRLITPKLLEEVLIVLNECIIRSVDERVYERIQREIKESISYIIHNEFDHSYSLVERIRRLNGSSLSKDEEEELEEIFKDKRIQEKIQSLFHHIYFWYYEVALNNYSMLEQIKILLICANEIKDEANLTFEKIMKSMYIDFDNKKVINLFKKRIIEEYLSTLDLEDILNNHIIESPHISFKLSNRGDTLLFDFKFSVPATKLIDFCMVASKGTALYKKSIYILYDLFGFRKDDYDRFYNEIEYLNIMNSSLHHKSKLLEYIVGENVLDVGPGGGALINLIEDNYPKLNVYGIDISSNVIEELNKKKIKENRHWNLVKGDALNLRNYFKKGSIDTIIFSSIIHELYSYIEYEGKKFNIHTVIKALQEAYEILPVGGRILIRDGIKTEPVDQIRIIEFKNKEDMNILRRYCNDFKGREITYKKIDQNKVKMLVNDAMEFLYTYTWGEDAYPLEVQEQFGYLTPTEYTNLILNNLPNSHIIRCTPFLQEGYEKNLLNKIILYDQDMNIVKLPNSTCIIVIEKQQSK